MISTYKLDCLFLRAAIQAKVLIVGDLVVEGPMRAK